MKSKWPLVWFVVSLSLAVLLLVQARQTRAKKQLIQELQLQVENAGTNQARRVAEVETERDRLRQQLQTIEAALRSSKLQSAAVSTAQISSPEKARSDTSPAPSAANSGGGMGNMFGAMLKDPEMRKAMEQQQRLALDMMYGSLVKKLGLPPEQEKQFKDILLEQQMENISQAGSLMDPASTNKTEIAQKLGEDRQQREERIKQLIGEDKFEEYQQYNQTIGERMLLDQFAKQVEMTPEQNEQVLSIMAEEKKNAQVNQGLQNFDSNKDWRQVLDSPEMAEKLFSLQEQANQRVLERAGTVLTPEQLQKLAPALQNQLEMQKAGMKMARQMFGGSAAAPVSPEAAQK